MLPDFKVSGWERSLGEILGMAFDFAACSHNERPEEEMLQDCTKPHVTEECQFIHDPRSAVIAEFENGTGFLEIAKGVNLPQYAHRVGYVAWLWMEVYRMITDLFMRPFSLGFAGRDRTMTSKKNLLRKFLKGIETGSALAAAVVDEERYIQHNPQTREGGEGIAALFARISKTDPKVTFVRVFEDGDIAFAHNEYDFADLKIAFEVFRFEDGKAVEHWDNIQSAVGPNPAGRGMTDGETEITDLDKTEMNRARVRAFAETVLIGGQLDKLADYVDDDLIQHGPELADGTAALRQALAASNGLAPARRYDTLHRVLAEGNFVLSMCEGAKHGTHAGLYDLYRLAHGRIVEHWSTLEAIPPRDQRKNDNGKF